MKKTAEWIQYGVLSMILGGAVFTGISMNAEAQTDTTPLTSQGSHGGNWDAEDQYWRQNYSSSPSYTSGAPYETYQPAYRYGSDLYGRNAGQSFDQLDQAELERGWNSSRGDSSLQWGQARGAVRDSYNRLWDGRSAGSTNTTINTGGTVNSNSGTSAVSGNTGVTTGGGSSGTAGSAGGSSGGGM